MEIVRLRPAASREVYIEGNIKQNAFQCPETTKNFSDFIWRTLSSGRSKIGGGPEGFVYVKVANMALTMPGGGPVPCYVSFPGFWHHTSGRKTKETRQSDAHRTFNDTWAR